MLPVCKIVSVKYLLVPVIFLLLGLTAMLPAKSQVVLEANGPGNTYELINSVLSPGNTSVESPDQCTSHPAFGRHIAEVFDNTLNQYVFEFYAHVTPDNDRCINFDRQRVEIKTYESSPANLKGTVGETITYKWKFRLAEGFKPSPSFTHIHQVKAVGGDDDDPLFTLTPRAGTTNTLQLIYVKESIGAASTIASANLSLFLGTWVEATETIKAGTAGTYSITLKRVSDGTTLLTYSNNNILSIRPDNDFIRPKWGIYRSLSNSSYLRDDTIRFAGITIAEGVTLPVRVNSFKAFLQNNNTQLSWRADNEEGILTYEVEHSNDGALYTVIYNIKAAQLAAYSVIVKGKSLAKQYYRLKVIEKSGSFFYTDIIMVDVPTVGLLSFYPNPAINTITIKLQETGQGSSIVIIDTKGQMLKSVPVISNSFVLDISALPSGYYTIKLLGKNMVQYYPLLVVK